MSELHEVEVAIDAVGNVTVEVRGVKGPTCVDLSKEMEQLLGGRVVRRERSAEYDLEPEGQSCEDWLRQRS